MARPRIDLVISDAGKAFVVRLPNGDKKFAYPPSQKAVSPAGMRALRRAETFAAEWEAGRLALSQERSDAE